MKFSATAGALLLASTALALPSPAALEKMQERRHERFRKRLATRREKGNFPLAVNHTAMNDHVLLGPSKHVSYDSNWAGAVQVGTGITEVTATFNNPKVSSSSSQAGAAAWVGIDGDTCQSAILQTGVSGVVSGGETQYAAWYEWYPNYSIQFSSFEVSPGDQVTATVKSTSKTAGTATIVNHSSGKTITHTFTNQGKYGDLCNENAEWIVEDFESGGSLIGFADFGTVTFTGASYVTNGATKGVTGSTIIDIKQNNKVVAKATTPSSSEIVVKYTG